MEEPAFGQSSEIYPFIVREVNSSVHNLFFGIYNFYKLILADEISLEVLRIRQRDPVSFGGDIMFDNNGVDKQSDSASDLQVAGDD